MKWSESLESGYNVLLRSDQVTIASDHTQKGASDGRGMTGCSLPGHSEAMICRLRPPRRH